MGYAFKGVDTVSKSKRAVVVGGGFIGLEMVENFKERGLEVTLVEKLDQVMPPLEQPGSSRRSRGSPCFPH